MEPKAKTKSKAHCVYTVCTRICCYLLRFGLSKSRCRKQISSYIYKTNVLLLLHTIWSINKAIGLVALLYFNSLNCIGHWYSRCQFSLSDWLTDQVKDGLTDWLMKWAACSQIHSFNKLRSDNCKCKLCCLPFYEYLPQSNRAQNSQWGRLDTDTTYLETGYRVEVHWAESHALHHVHWVRFLSVFWQLRNLIVFPGLSAAIKAKCYHIKQLLNESSLKLIPSYGRE